MGVSDNMLHKETSKVASGSHCEGRSGRVPTGNGHVAPAPKYKARKVSAVRDFPPGCGRFAAPITRPSEIAQVPVASESGKPPTLLSDQADQIDCQNPQSGLKPHPSGSSLVNPSPRNYRPRRGVTAVRDFPPFCGRNAPPLSGEERMKWLNSLKDKGYKPEKKFVNEEKPSEKTTCVDVKQVIQDVVQDINSVEGKLEGSAPMLAEDVGFKPEVLACEKLRKQGACEASARNDMEDESLEENPLRDVVVYAVANSDGAESSRETCTEKNSSSTRRAHQSLGQVATRNEKDLLQLDGQYCYDVAQRSSKSYDVSLPPTLRGGVDHDNDAITTRKKAKETLRLFQTIYRKLLKEEESKLSGQEKTRKRVDLLAAKVIKEKGKDVNKGKPIIGTVPGIEVGDEFQYFVELNLVGLHRQSQAGIDSVKQGDKLIATSVIAGGGYEDDLDDSDVLSYMGQGGNVMQKGKQPEDQKLERGNLALANSRFVKNPVRVIRGQSDGKSKTYVYDGLYLVEEYKQEPGPHGKLVYKFKLVRIPGQPELAWKVVKKTNKSKVREGLCVRDISHGKEKMPICAINTLDSEKPPPFVYVSHMIYPDWCHPVPAKGCDCVSGCSESGKCSCVMKNGGEFPYNHSGAIVEAKTLVYECGPTCRCPSTCYNRVSQHGIKFQLEIFKTESRGWGVRSLNSIPSGSFICEYAGELLEDKEAEERKGSDEYLFDIGNNYCDSSLRSGLSTIMPDAQSSLCQIVQGSGFTIDAGRCGNIGRFINHSCSPNLYAQDVLYDHDDKRIPHIMLFAAENIPPLQELTYHYNYMIDQVRDENGNIKKKICRCGSSECTGRLY